MTDKLSLYNGALLILKQRSLSALTEARSDRYALDTAYDGAVAYCLEQGHWNFATRTSLLEAATDEEPEFGYTSAFLKPDDYVRLCAISVDERQQDPLMAFVDEGDHWYCDESVIYVSYVSRDASYGLNLNRWPKTFVRFVEFELADRVAGQVTSMGLNELAALSKRRDIKLKDARSKDGQNQGPKRPPVGRLVRARAGRRLNAIWSRDR